MKSARRHLSFANIASLLALVFSMSGGALAARHYLINSTSQINPKVLKKLKGTPGQIGPIGPQGPTGETGPKGPNGGRGEPAPSVLATGSSESGDFGVRGAAAGASITETLAFRIPLAAAVPPAQVRFTKFDAPTPTCPGPGLAGKGFLCIYATGIAGVKETESFNAEGERLPGSGRYGFILEVTPEPAEEPVFEGTYTVTGA